MEKDQKIIEITAYAEELVDSTIMQAIEKVKGMEKTDEIQKIKENENMEEKESIREIEKTRELEINCPSCPGCQQKDSRSDFNHEWPTSENMTVRDGLKFLKKMMKTWKSDPAMYGWKFYAEFIGLETDGKSDFYSYQVRWSFPTPAYPEPQVTVSVFFTIEAAGNKYPECPVDIRYVFEGNKFAHRPTMTFRPKWIYDVLDMKTMMFKSFTF